jgi:hypothetical protein
MQSSAPPLNAGINQVNDAPPEWEQRATGDGRRATGDGKRFGSNFGVAAVTLMVIAPFLSLLCWLHMPAR